MTHTPYTATAPLTVTASHAPLPRTPLTVTASHDPLPRTPLTISVTHRLMSQTCCPMTCHARKPQGPPCSSMSAQTNHRKLRHTLTECMYTVNKITCNLENVSAYAAFKTFRQENYSLQVQEKNKAH